MIVRWIIAGSVAMLVVSMTVAEIAYRHEQKSNRQSPPELFAILLCVIAGSWLLLTALISLVAYVILWLA